MAWITMLDDEEMSIRQDTEDGSLILELNDGGITPEYVTVRLDREQAAKLAEVLARYVQAG